MRVLVLGGTVFLGRHVVDALVARGVRATLFHRGRHGADLFPDVERVLGDRGSDLDRLPAGAEWDAVIDTSGYLPKQVTIAAATLRGRVERYVFVSSVSVYRLDHVPIDESSPTLPLPQGARDDIVDAETYGPLKALCERAVEDAFGSARTFVVRPGLIVGPHDPTDRFTYWPVRFARGGDVLVPDDFDAPVQFIDVRDVAAFLVDAVLNERSGTVNAVGPAESTTFGSLIEACRAASSTPARPVAADVAKLLARGVAPWSDLPVWIPSADESAPIARVDPAHGIALGLRHRTIDVTVRDTLRWAVTARGEGPLAAGLTPQREAELLAVLAS